MIYRVTAALIMMSTLNIPWFVEQPGSSLMEHHPAFQHLCKRFTVYKVFIWLGAYGGDCPKPTLIYSNFKFIEKLFLPLPADKVWEAETSIKYVDSSGQHRVSGGRDLKSTQAYPRLFGHAVAQLFLSERDAVRQAIAERKTLGLVADCVSSEWSKEEWANLDQKD
ncbi:unnamed protein product [Durusdinium trenchii]|uniref:Uncharacterized protein n=1 Tax=Durusdinium trenchii TaxID=1381693 RepID=A0ABP0ILH8_9DINO